MAGGQAEDGEAVFIEVLALIDQRRIERRRQRAGAQVVQELLADPLEVGMTLAGQRRRADQFDVPEATPMVEGQHLLGRQLQFVRRRADEIAEHVRVDQGSDTFGSSGGLAEPAGAVQEHDRLARTRTAAQDERLVGGGFDARGLRRRQPIGRRQPGHRGSDSRRGRWPSSSSGRSGPALRRASSSAARRRWTGSADIVAAA